MPAADARRFYRSIRGSLGAAVAVLTLDVGFLGSILFSTVLCPLWILVSLVRSSLYGPNASLFLTQIAIPMATFLLVLANDAFQRGVAERNSEKVVAACESYRRQRPIPREARPARPSISELRPGREVLPGPGTLHLLLLREHGGRQALLVRRPAAPSKGLRLRNAELELPRVKAPT